ncbi:hypothetical protein DOTSEDRAFT_74789 [Dothistroma septosporum NZE10]|uniref:Uncharacterized protein n=1 Tax=Dothistroma septosporum (strain NZE10 / CBS 128990) TaxID=675120 RepID=N1PEK4_DOTSN|nr:hypothetical protein DOTSEDRAFT_74789 [Dothistroma septosporum NZE10]
MRFQIDQVSGHPSLKPGRLHEGSRDLLAFRRLCLARLSIPRRNRSLLSQQPHAKIGRFLGILSLRLGGERLLVDGGWQTGWVREGLCEELSRLSLMERER